MLCQIGQGWAFWKDRFWTLSVFIGVQPVIGKHKHPLHEIWGPIGVQTVIAKPLAYHPEMFGTSRMQSDIYFNIPVSRLLEQTKQAFIVKISESPQKWIVAMNVPRNTVCTVSNENGVPMVAPENFK